MYNWSIFNYNLSYIGNFSRGFNFRWVRDLPEIAKNTHGEKLTLLYFFIESPWKAKIGLSENLTQLQSGIFAKIPRCEKIAIYGKAVIK